MAAEIETRLWKTEDIAKPIPRCQPGSARPIGLVMQRRHRLARSLSGLGCLGLLVMALTHVAERFQILPGMGWGLPNSPGHYLDLFSAVAGAALLLAAYVVRRISN